MGEQEVANLETETQIIEKQLPEHDFDVQLRMFPQTHARSLVRPLWPEAAPPSVLHAMPEGRAGSMPRPISAAGDLAAQVAEIESFVEQLRPVTQSVKQG